jgi:hypothetical protein
MKSVIVRLVLLLLVAVMFGCSQFPTEFSNVTNGDVRVLDFIYEPAEAAPGDTVHVKAIFGGKPVTPQDIDWKVSFNVVSNVYGTDTAFDVKSLGMKPVLDSFSENTSCLKFSFVVPSDIMHTSGAIPQDWKSIIPNKDAVPPEFSNLTKTQLLTAVEELIKTDQNKLRSAADSLPEYRASIALLCQFLTVKLRIFADVKNDYEIVSDYSVRYNSVLKNSGIVYENYNPRIDSIGIYKVPGTRTLYNPAENIHEFIRLDMPKGKENTVLIDKGYTYFVNVFASNADTFQTLKDIYADTMSKESLIKKPLTTEQFYTTWFYQLNSDEVKDLGINDFMHVNGGDTLMATLIPPSDQKIVDFTIWSTVKDDIGMSNVVNRPMGSSLIEVHGKFAYTQEYLDDVKKKKK